MKVQTLIQQVLCYLLIVIYLIGCQSSMSSKNINDHMLEMIDTPDMISTPPQLLPLTDSARWQANHHLQDPLIAHQPMQVICDSWWIEDGLLEVATIGCNYFSMSQNIRIDLLANTVIRTGLIHDALVLTDERIDLEIEDHIQAHVALLINQQIMWEKEINIPNSPQYYPIEFLVPQTISKGDLITLHLHNHGANQWRWFEILYKE